MRLAEKLHAPVVNTLLGKGAVDETHPLHLGMLGMHGTAYANKAVIDCDLIMAIGARWDDRITGKLDEFCTGRDEDPHRHRPRRVQQDHPARRRCRGDARLRDRGPDPAASSAATPRSGSTQCDKLAEAVSRSSTPSRAACARSTCSTGWTRSPRARRIITTDVGQHQMWAAQFCLTTQEPPLALARAAPARWASASPRRSARSSRCPDKQVWAVVGDGGFQMTLCELATAAVHKLPVKVPDHQQQLPGHGAPVAGAVLRQPPVAAWISRAIRTS